jgi:serine/threonine protein kinase
MNPRCSHCGTPWTGNDGTVCPACRLQSALPTAGELYADFATRFAGSPPSRFEALCKKHPRHAEELRALHQMATSARSSYAGGRLLTHASNPMAPGGPLQIMAATWPSGSRYQVEGVVERGGLGIVYAVRDRELDRLLAMKVIGMSSEDHPPIPMEELPPAWVEGFVEEARILARLDHPGIVPIHELGLDPQGRLYFTARLVEGRCLHEIFRLAREHLQGWNIRRASRAFLQACEAVACAHQLGVLHRNLRPDAIVVGELGEVYVLDWGVACSMRGKDLHDLRPRTASASMPYDASTPGTPPDSDTSAKDAPIITRDGTVLGIPAYMSPEQAHGRMESVGTRSDVYSLGAMLYELIKGHGPYLDASPPPSGKQVLDAVRSGPPTAIALPANDPFAGLVPPCNKAMSRDPLARHGDAGELVGDLRAWLDGPIKPEQQTGAFAKLKSWILRHRHRS